MSEIGKAVNDYLRNTWESIINDTNHHLIVCEESGRIVASCVCVIIPNLTRNAGYNSSDKTAFIQWIDI